MTYKELARFCFDSAHTLEETFDTLLEEGNIHDAHHCSNMRDTLIRLGYVICINPGYIPNEEVLEGMGDELREALNMEDCCDDEDTVRRIFACLLFPAVRRNAVPMFTIFTAPIDGLRMMFGRHTMAYLGIDN